MTDKVQLPPTISILSPRPAGILPRGRNNPKGADPQRNYRCPDDKWQSIVQACDLLSMNPAEFARWVTYLAANEVIRIAREQQVAPPAQVVQVQNTKPKNVVPARVVNNPYGLK